MAQKRRTYRIAEKLRSIVAQALLFARDERLQLVTISSVQVSPDLRYAKIFWMVTDPERRRDLVEQALNERSTGLRRQVARELGTRHVPELQFLYDNTLDAMENVERLLKQGQPSGESETEGDDHEKTQ